MELKDGIIKHAEEEAFEWSVDYKPWETDLEPNQYARHGFEQGYKRALRDLMDGLVK